MPWLPSRSVSCWGREGSSLTSSAGADPSRLEPPACPVPGGPGCPPPCQSAALLGKQDTLRSVVTSPRASVGIVTIPTPGGHTPTAQEVIVSLCNPPQWALCIPGKPRQMLSCHPSCFQIPESQNSPFWKGHRKITESNNAQCGSSKGLRTEKAASAKGLCKIHGEVR